MLVLTVGMVFLSVLEFSLWQLKATEKWYLQEYKLLSQIASTQVEASYLSGVWPFEVLHQLTKSGNVVFWRVVKPDGTIKIADDVALWGKKVTQPELVDIEVLTIKESRLPTTREKIKIVIVPLNIMEKSKPWNFWLGISLKNLMFARRQAILTGFVLCLVALLISGIASFLLARRITKPISELVRSTRMISSGNLEHKAKATTGNELGSLAESFNEMADSLKKTMVSRKSLSSIINSIADPLVVTDTEGKINTVNPSLLELLGYSEQELVGKPAGTLLAEAEAEAEAEAVLLKERGLARIFKGTVVRGSEATCISKSGERIPVSISGQVVKDTLGEIGGVVAVLRDLREARKLQQQLVQVEKMSAVGLMAGGVAHELNNPLGVILGYIQLLLGETSKDDPTHQDLKTVESAVHRCKTIVQNLLSFSRQEKVVSVPVSVAQVLQSVLTLIGHQMEVNGVKIVQNIQDNLYSVKGNVQQLEQVFVNIMVNAQDAMPGGGELTINAENIDKQVRIVFKDTGCGISPDILNRLFEPFVTTKPPGKGTGLGLSVSYGIIKDYGGNIEIQSKEGTGTAVTITLPALL